MSLHNADFNQKLISNINKKFSPLTFFPKYILNAKTDFYFYFYIIQLSCSE